MRLPSARARRIALLVGASALLLSAGLTAAAPRPAPSSPQAQPASQAQRQRPRPPLVAQGLAVVPDVRTKLEFALMTPNALIHADYHQIDSRFGPNIRIDAVVVRVGNHPEVVRGLRVQVPEDTRGGDPEGSSYLDAEEIDGLIDALSAMVDLVRNWTAGDDRKLTSLSFTSLDSFRVEIREGARFQRGFIYTGLVDQKVTPFELADLPVLKQAFELAGATVRRK